jgi:DNA-binding MarR family transcriptional regulator
MSDAQNGVSHGRLDLLLGYALRRAQLRVFADFARAMAALRLTPGQLGAVLLVEANPGLSQSALAAALGIDRSTAVALIDALQRRGLIRRRQDVRDRRVNALELGATGRRALAGVLRQLEAHEARIAADLAPAERRELMRLLARVAPAAAR